MEDLRLYRKKEIKNMEKNKIAFLMTGGNAVKKKVLNISRENKVIVVGYRDNRKRNGLFLLL